MDRFYKKPARYTDELDNTDCGIAAALKKLYASGKTYPLPDSVKRGSEGFFSMGKSVRTGVSKVYAEDYDALKKKILDPNSNFVQMWNKIFVLSCLAALFVDPFFFFLPAISDAGCIKIQRTLKVVVTILRTITDIFYLFHMALQFRTAYVAPSSRVFGRGVLVVNPKLIASHYLRRTFCLDLIAVLPIPQVVIWSIASTTKELVYQTKNALRFIVFFQYIPRLFLIFPLTSQIVKATGVITETAWAGAAYNLVLYILASHFIGACWYLLAIERKDTCWRQYCKIENGTDGILCHYNYLYCSSETESQQDARKAWYNVTNVTTQCDSVNESFNFGIYQAAFDQKIVSEKFMNKYFYCLWWGLQQLSSLGQNLQTSTFIWEIIFAIFIAIVGLVLFALLIGNMQTYLQSLGVRLEEWRVKQGDTEEWMRHRQLPQELRERVRRFNQYKWVATRGADEEAVLQSLPPDLRRDIKRHLCLSLVLQVPLFNEMDDRLLDAICERLKPVLCTKDTIIMREGDPVNEMLFIIRGVLDSMTTNGGRTGFLNQSSLGPGHFCGEELLTWVLNPKPSVNLPSSTRTVQAVGEVEAFALTAEDLKFVAKQFRRLHSKELQHTFRFYSHQWRTWAAIFIQTAWRRYKKRKSLALLCSMEEDYLYTVTADTNDDPSTYEGATVLASSLGQNVMRGVNNQGKVNNTTSGDSFLKVPKPEEPDFGLDGEEAHE